MASFQDIRARGFDGRALFAAMDQRRREDGLSWAAVTRGIWSLSADLNVQRDGDLPIAASTIAGMGRTGGVGCHHALFFLRWLGRDPEDYAPGHPALDRPTALPAAGPDQRLRWNLRRLHGALDDQRVDAGLTWGGLAAQVGCQPGQLSGLARVRFGIGMGLAMRAAGVLRRPAADFVDAAGW